MKKNRILIEMFAGMSLWGILWQMIVLLIGKRILYCTIGLWLGIVISAVLAVHMKYSIEDAIDIGGYDARKKIRSDIMKRYLVVGVVIGILFYLNWGNPLTVLVGIFALKISAYLQPHMHKLFEKIGG